MISRRVWWLSSALFALFCACGESEDQSIGVPGGPGADGGPNTSSADDDSTSLDGAATPSDSGSPLPVKITTDILLGELTDLRRLAYKELAPFTHKMESSYDRRSKTPGSGNANGATPFDCDGWWANFDGNGFIREETNQGRKERVLLDAEGPGAFMRMWSANPRGTLRFYFDNATTAALEVPMEDFLTGKVEPFVSPFGYSAVTGQLDGKNYPAANLYFPIPYRSHLKITVDVPAAVPPFNGGIFYQINYRTYDSATADVETFDRTKVSTYARNLVGLGMGVPELTLPKAETMKETAADLKADTATSVLSVGADSGGSRIREIVFDSVPTDAASLRGTLVRMVFDGEETVYAPIGDFFGGGPGATDHVSLPLSSKITGGTVALTSRWVMPFQSTAEISLVDATGKHVVTKAHVFTEPYPFDDTTFLFHAAYRPQKNFPARPVQDWNIATVEGEGNYVGTIVNITNPNGAWWGEGDEKVYVDGESFPSFFGTGTEDYFGYAWGSPQLFSRPFHAQVRYDLAKDPNNRISNARYHVFDRIPFNTSIRFDLEVERWETANPGLYLDGVAIFYAKKGGKVNVPKAANADLSFKSF